MKTCKRDCVSRYVLRCEKSENLEKVRNYFLLQLWRLARVVEAEMFNIIANCESRRNFIEAFLTKLVKSKDARSRPVHKISIVTHAIVASIVVGDLIKLHCLAELAFLNLHCRVVDTQLAKAFVSDRSNNATVFAFLYFYKRVALLAHFLRSGSKEKGRRTIRFRSRFFN